MVRRVFRQGYRGTAAVQVIRQTSRKQPGEKGKEARRLGGGVRRERASPRRSTTVRGQEMDNRRQDR